MVLQSAFVWAVHDKATSAIWQGLAKGVSALISSKEITDKQPT